MVASALVEGIYKLRLVDGTRIGTPVGIGVEAPTDDAFGRDVKHLWIGTGDDGFAARLMQFDIAKNFDATRPPRIDGSNVVNDESDMRVLLDIAPFFALGEATMTADVEGVGISVEAEGNGRDVRLTVRADSGETAQALAFQVVYFGGREHRVGRIFG